MASAALKQYADTTAPATPGIGTGKSVFYPRVVTGVIGYYFKAEDGVEHALQGVPDTRQVVAGAGMTGGGALISDVTLNVIAADASIIVGANSINAGAFNDLSTLHPATGDISANSQKVTGLAAGVAGTDATNLTQVTGLISAAIEGRSNKDPVDWGTTAAITLSGLGTQGGGEWTGSLTATQRILVKNQASSAANGVYTPAAGAWVRVSDVNTGAEITNASVLVRFGATLAGDTYTQTATVTTIGTDAQTWVQTGEGATYAADGTSITLTGTTFSRNALTGDVTAPAGSSATTLASVITAGGPTGSTSVVPVITWDAKGRLTAVTTATITAAAIGAQPLDATLTALAAANWAADALPIGTGADTLTQTTFAANTFPAKASTGALVAKTITDFGLSLVDDANAAAAQTTLGLVIGTNVQAFDQTLQALAAANWAANSIPVGTGADTLSQTAIGANQFLARSSAGNVAAKTITDFGLSLVDDVDASAARTTLGLVIGTDVQAFDSDLATIAGLTATTDNFMQAKAGAWASRTIAQVKTDLSLAGSNTGDQTITLTGDVTGSGTGSFAATLASVITAGGPTGSGTVVPVITWDAKGRLTAVTTASITAAGIGAVASVTAADASIIVGGTSTNPTIQRAALTGDITASAGSNATTLSNVGPGATGPIGTSSVTPVITIDAKGRVTALTSATITPAAIGAVASVTATDSSIVVGGTATNPTIQRAALTGDITASAGSNTTTLANTGPGATGPIGSTSTTPVVTIDAKGRVTALTSATITPAAIGAVASVTAADASIVIGGTATNPTVQRAALTGDITASAGSNATTLASVIVAGSVGSSTQIPVITYDAKGRITAVTTATPSAGITAMTAVGAAPNANAATISGSNLTLQPASSAFPGVMVASDYRRIRWVLNAVEDFGFVGDARVTFDGGSNTGSPTKITSATMAFTAADLGKRITLSFSGAASGNAKYVGVITNIDSATQVTVSPNIQRTVGPNGLIVETDNTTAIGNMATAINALVYPGVEIVFPSSATNRYGFPVIVPTLNKPVTISAQGRFYNDDYGNYWTGGGTALAWSGPSYDGGTAFRGLFRFEPATGASAQHMHGTSFRDVWIDGRNGDQYQMLYGIQMYSQEGFSIRRFGAIDCIAAAVEFDITSPVGGTAATARGTMEDFGIRALDPDAAVSIPTVTTTSSAVTLSTTPQNLTVAAAINTLYSAGYAWFETEAGYPVLVNFTGGGTTTTLTGCTVSAKDAALTPKTLSGCNVVFANPNNGAALKFGGDSSGNTNLSHFRMGQINFGTNYGAAAMDLRNADSIVFQQVVLNGGNATIMATGPTVKRKTRPGYTLAGSDVSTGLACRNVVIQDGDAGVGGVTSLALKGGGTKMLAPAGPNYIFNLQHGNGQPAPLIEAGSYLDWTSNGGGNIGLRSISQTASVALVVGTATLIPGTQMLLGPQAMQIGTNFHWEFQLGKTGAGTTAHSLTIRVGATGTNADPAVQTFSMATTAATDNTFIALDYNITTLAAGSANGVATMYPINKIAAAAAGFWTQGIGAPPAIGTPTAFTAPVTPLQYIGVYINIGTGTTGMASSFGKGIIERVGNQAA